MSNKKVKKAKRSSVKTLVILALAVSFCYTVISQEFDIRKKKAELNAIEQQTVAEENENKALADEKKMVNTSEYKESVARELGYAAPDEIVFVDATAQN